MKKLIALLLTLLMIMALSACSVEDITGKLDDEDVKIFEGSSDKTFAMNDGTTVERQTIFQGDDITVLLVGIEGTKDEPRLIFSVENGKRGAINISLEELNVDGWNVYGSGDLYDIPGHSITCRYSEIDVPVVNGDAVLSGIGDITFTLRIYDDDYDDIVEGKEICIKTSASGTVETLAPDGVCLYDDKDVKVVSTKFAKTSGSNYRLYLMVANDRREKIRISCDEAEIDGEAIDVWFSAYLDANEKQLTDFYLERADGTELVLEPGDVLTFKLIIEDMDYSEICNQEVTCTYNG